MKNKLVIFVCIFAFVFSLSETGFAQNRAKDNDTVWVLINHVKADKTQQFEEFIHEIFWPAASKLTSEEQEVFDNTRVLHPVKPEEDGTFTYVFIMDPALTGRNYDIENLLIKQYGDEKGEEYYKMYEESLSADQTGYVLIQH